MRKLKQRRLQNTCKHLQLLNGGTEIQTQAVWLQGLLSFLCLLLFEIMSIQIEFGPDLSNDANFTANSQLTLQIKLKRLLLLCPATEHKEKRKWIASQSTPQNICPQLSHCQTTTFLPVSVWPHPRSLISLDCRVRRILMALNWPLCFANLLHAPRTPPLTGSSLS